MLQEVDRLRLDGKLDNMELDRLGRQVWTAAFKQYQGDSIRTAAPKGEPAVCFL